MGHFVKEFDGYFVVFHNKAHNRAPFIRRFPQVPSNQVELVEAEQNVMDQKWHNIEVGKKAGAIWLKVDGKTIIQASDKDIVGAGHLIFRLRGTKDKIASVLIKDVIISEFEN